VYAGACVGGTTKIKFEHIDGYVEDGLKLYD